MLVPEKFEFKFESVQPWTRLHPPSPLSDPLTCIAPGAVDRSPGEEANLFKVSLKTLLPCEDVEDWSRRRDGCDPQLVVVLSIVVICPLKTRLIKS